VGRQSQLDRQNTLAVQEFMSGFENGKKRPRIELEDLRIVEELDD
jgi:hypothetical protein